MSKNDKILDTALEINEYIEDIELAVLKADFITDIIKEDVYGATDDCEKLFIFDNITLMSEMLYDYVSQLIKITENAKKQQALFIAFLKGAEENARKENAD